MSEEVCRGYRVATVNGLVGALQHHTGKSSGPTSPDLLPGTRRELQQKFGPDTSNHSPLSPTCPPSQPEAPSGQQPEACNEQRLPSAPRPSSPRSRTRSNRSASGRVEEHSRPQWLLDLPCPSTPSSRTTTTRLKIQHSMCTTTRSTPSWRYDIPQKHEINIQSTNDDC